MWVGHTFTFRSWSVGTGTGTAAEAHLPCPILPSLSAEGLKATFPRAPLWKFTPSPSTQAPGPRVSEPWPPLPPPPHRTRCLPPGLKDTSTPRH